jgi:teichuronic acid biosynthesis glycosyltransferase TuaC
LGPRLGVKVLTYTSLFPNQAQPDLGVFIYQRMAHFAAREKNQVIVVAPIPYAPSWISAARWKKWTGIPPVEHRGNLTIYHPAYPMLPKVSLPLQALLMLLGSFSLVQKLHRAHKFDLIDAHFVYPDGLAGVLLGRLLKVPAVVSARGTDINLYPKYRFIRPQIRYALRKAVGAIAVCKALQDVMVSLAGPGRHVQVIGNGVDTSRFFPIPQGAACRELNLSLDGPMVVAVGALVPRKGYHFLIPAFAQICEQFPGAHLYILGEGESRGELQQMIRTLGLAGRVHLQGNCPNARLRFWYGAANVSCLVSSREGWPNVLLESLACGTPVVATGLWGTPEVITSPDLGVIVDQTIPCIASGLKSALERNWNREQIAAHARERDWNVVAQELEEYLALVLQR